MTTLIRQPTLTTTTMGTLTPTPTTTTTTQALVIHTPTMTTPATTTTAILMGTTTTTTDNTTTALHPHAIAAPNQLPSWIGSESSGICLCNSSLDTEVFKLKINLIELHTTVTSGIKH